MAITIISDKVNRAGFRVNVAGIKLDNYAKNPILLFMHNRAGNDWSGRTKKEERLPVGKLVNLRVEKGALVADDPIWDEKDEFAMTLKSKFEGGFMSAFSAGLIPITISDAPEWLLQGQTRSTVVESEMIEVSFVDIPKDGDAVRLSMADGASMDDLVPVIKNSQQSNSDMDLKKIALKLGLKSDAGEEEVIAAIAAIATELDGHRKSRTATLLALGRQKGVVNDTNAKQWERTIELDFDNAEALLNNFVVPSANTDTISTKPTTAEELLKLAADKNVVETGKKGREQWGFEEWSKQDPKGLNEMRLKEPGKYEKLALDYAQA